MTSTANGTLLALQSEEGDFSGSLWVTTSTSTAVGVTTPLVDWGPWFPTDATRFGDDALVWFSDFQQTSELWRTDGTVDGTRLVMGGMQSYDARLVPAGNLVFFVDVQQVLWVSDGTTDGTHRLHTWGNNGQGGSVLVMRLATAGPLAFFNVQSPLANGDEMWVSDGTHEGTHLLKDINPGPTSGRPGWLTPMGSQMFFVADDGRHGREVWRSNGTAAGTKRITDQPMPQLRDLTPCRDKLYFITLDATSAALWSTDGTAGGLERVADLPGSSHSWRQEPRGLTCTAWGLLFAANDGVHGREPWTWLEGSDAAVLHDLLPGEESSHPAHFTRLGDNTYLRATDGEHGHELWVVTS